MGAACAAGFGAAPHILAPILTAMGARLLYNTPARKHEASAEWCALGALLEKSDIVSLHLPLTPDSERMIDADAFHRMKPGAILINTARGGLIDEPALTLSLNGNIAGSVDSSSFEPKKVRYFDNYFR